MRRIKLHLQGLALILALSSPAYAEDDGDLGPIKIKASMVAVTLIQPSVTGR